MSGFGQMFVSGLLHGSLARLILKHGRTVHEHATVDGHRFNRRLMTIAMKPPRRCQPPLTHRRRLFVARQELQGQRAGTEHLDHHRIGVVERT